MFLKKIGKMSPVAAVVFLSACGEYSAMDSRLQVANGIQLDDKDWPSVMVLEESSDSTNWISKCSAVYLGERLVLTASHCLRKQTEAIFDAVDVGSIEQLRIRSQTGAMQGIRRAYLEPFDWGRVRQGSRIFSGFLGYDLALLELAGEPTEAGAVLLTPKSATALSQVMESQELMLVGYQGTYKATYGQQPAIRYLDPAQTFLFAGTGTREGATICTGDSGGGVFVKTETGYALKGIISFYISRNFGVASPDKLECETGTYSGIVDLQQPGAADFISRGKLALSDANTVGPVIFKNTLLPSETPGRQEAENFVSAVDFSFGNQGASAKTNSLQQNTDIFSDASSLTTYIGATEIGESLTYAVATTLEGPVTLTFRLRNSSDKIPGRIVVRTDQRSIVLQLAPNSLDWQSISVPMDIGKPGRRLRFGVEILSPVDFDWFSIEKP